ncbi:hypothetical protein DN069_14185 [Streptacidiphilus pinicola]|uniref:Uncharacterized protein n=1 Tax=Streptacidiphilus pinicola TaxID=2219663 RepID=A0A2X0J411_9ACTN|nr:hypothetical protein [Streptacidiphilus pinicola]RAG84966.1 hypothetical protein DN069_14185 [Streptacidiphilus pinicola]
MIADLTPADLVADPTDCLPIFEERVRAEQRRLALLQEVVRELRGIEEARTRLQALLDGDVSGLELLPDEALMPRPRAPRVPVALVHEPGSRRVGGPGSGGASGGEPGRRGRPGRHLDRALEVLAAEPERRFSAPQIAAQIGADADWLRFVLHSAANRGLVQRHSQSRPMGGRGRPVVIQFSAARTELPSRA